MKRLAFLRIAGLAGILSLAAASANAQNLVQNGSFEDPSVGDGNTAVFTGWNSGGNFVTGNTFYNAYGAHAGEQWLGFGCVGDECGTWQMLDTTPGQGYTFSFWYASDGFLQNSMNVFWNGSNLFGTANDPAHGWEEYTFSVTALGNDVIRFSGRDDPRWLSIDDVCVSANGACSAETTTPEPASLALLIPGLLGLGVVSRRHRA